MYVHLSDTLCIINIHKNYAWELKSDPAFKHSREVLQAKRKSLKAAGKGNKDRQAEPFSQEEIESLKAKGMIGSGKLPRFYSCVQKSQKFSLSVTLNSCCRN